MIRQTTARVPFLCVGCESHFAPGTTRTYVDGWIETVSGLLPRTFSLCPLCVDLDGRYGYPVRDSEPDEPGRCSPYIPKRRAKPAGHLLMRTP